MCTAPATAQQSFFRRVVFFERPFRAYEARCPDRSSPYVLPRGKHAVVTFGVLQSVATLLVHAVLWHLQWMSGAFLLPSFGQDVVASRARARTVIHGSLRGEVATPPWHLRRGAVRACGEKYRYDAATARAARALEQARWAYTREA